MAESPKTPGQTPFRRRIPLELTSEEYELLESKEHPFGTKRATLVAGLRALARLGSVEREAQAASKACQQADKKADELERKIERLERELAKAQGEASTAKRSRQSAERKGKDADADVRALNEALATELEARLSLEEELRELEEEALAAVRCARCGAWAPPSEWASKRKDGREFVYHEPCGFHAGGLLDSPSILGFRD